MKAANIFSKNINVGKLFDIPFKLHWTIIPFFIFIPLLGLYYNMGIQESLLLLLLVICIIISVLLHELGHARAAKSMGIETHDILISLIGGAARLEYMPEEPIKEFKIAIAGPLVNLLIFTILGIPLALLSLAGLFVIDFAATDLERPSVFIGLLALSNLCLFLFNLLPAFPMDGGRILRAFLATKMSREKATNIASIIGKIFAVIMVICGIVFIYPISALIGIFIFMMADLENNQEKNNNRFKKVMASTLANKEYSTARLSTPMNSLIEEHFEKGTENFVVIDHAGKPKGIIDRYRLDDAMREKNGDMTVSYYLSSRYAIANVNNNLMEVYEMMVPGNYPLALVMDYGEIVGVIEKEELFAAYKAK